MLIEFRGSALTDLRDFPISVRREAGYQLDQVQQGGEPDDWKPMKTIGQGVREIRFRDEAGLFRVIYVAKFADAVCFSSSPISLKAGRISMMERWSRSRPDWIFRSSTVTVINCHLGPTWDIMFMENAGCHGGHPLKAAPAGFGVRRQNFT